MQVTHYFDASLTSPVITTIPAMQGDGVRLIVARLMEGEEPWVVPEGVSAGLSYELPDKDPGYYDQLSDGAPACVIDGSQVSVVLEPALTERAGPVKASIILRDPDGVQVATFPFHLWVERVPGLVHGENMAAPSHMFEGKIYYGGNGGILLPLGLGRGVRVEQQEDSSLLLVVQSGSGEIDGEMDPTVPEWAKQPSKPEYTAAEVGADPAGTADVAVVIHNVDDRAHPDIRDELTNKVSAADIVDNLVTNVANKPLSAAMGVALAADIGSVRSALAGYQPKGDYLTQHQDISHLLPREELPGAVDERIRTFESSHDLELLTTFTLTEAVSTLTIDRDSNNEPFELEAVTIELHTGTDGRCGEGNSGGIQVAFGGITTAYMLRLFWHAGFPYRGYELGENNFRDSGFAAYATVRNNLGVCGGYSGDFGSFDNVMLTTQNYKYVNTPITQITVHANLPINATISVYGARRGNNA